MISYLSKKSKPFTKLGTKTEWQRSTKLTRKEKRKAKKWQLLCLFYAAESRSFPQLCGLPRLLCLFCHSRGGTAQALQKNVPLKNTCCPCFCRLWHASHNPLPSLSPFVFDIIWKKGSQIYKKMKKRQKIYSMVSICLRCEDGAGVTPKVSGKKMKRHEINPRPTKNNYSKL